MEIKIPFILNTDDLTIVLAALKSTHGAAIAELEDAKAHNHHKRARFAEDMIKRHARILDNFSIPQGYESDSFELDPMEALRRLTEQDTIMAEIQAEKDGTTIDDSSQPQPDGKSAKVISILEGFKHDGD